jgi:hypothetical protein
MKDDVKHFLDYGAVGTALLALLDFLPHVSALLSIIWIALRIREQLVKQGYLKDRRQMQIRLDDE